MPVPESSAKAVADSLFTASLADADPEIAEAIRLELGRQRDEIELIASENIVSRAVLEAQGSVMTNKYAEGLPGRRYYGGCHYVDVAENPALDLSAHHRLPRFPRDRRQRRREAHGRHGALCGAGRGRGASKPGPARSRRDLDDAQDAARAARRLHPDQRRGTRKEDQFGGVP